MHADDECYSLLRGPAENMTILATGKVTQTDVPDDFPSAEAVSKRPFKTPVK